MQFKQFNRLKPNSNPEKGIFSSASTKCIPRQRLSNKIGLKKSFIKVPFGETQKEAKIYQWRLKTEFPIVKINSFCIKSSSQQKSTFMVEVQEYDVRLTNIQGLPLFKIIYLLKESLIAFQRLFYLYGTFTVTPNMIALNHKSQCKVWISQNFASNQTISSTLDQKDFLLSIYELFESKTNRLKNSQAFFEELKQYKTFCNALNFIEEYSKANKINVPSMCLITQKEKIQTADKIFDTTLTINKLPIKFNINTPLRVSLQNKPNVTILSRQNEEQQTSVKLKKSDDTAAEPFERKSGGLQNEDYFFIQNTLFKDQGYPQPLARSHLQPQLKSKASFSRKFSGQYPSIKCCFSPQRPTVNLVSPKKVPKSKWNENVFTNCEIEQETPLSQSKWQKTLNGLFNGSQSLKKSIHNGRQQRAVEICQKFDLLDNFGKAIKQSYVHEEMDSFQY